MPRELFTVLLVMLAGAAAAWQEPARSRKTRSALMDAIPPVAEWKPGAPVQFMVHHLRRDGNVAFAGLTAQRPGGAAIDPSRTQAVLRGEEDGSCDISGIFVLYRKSADTWVAVHHGFGETGAWWSGEPFCRYDRAETPDACAPLDRACVRIGRPARRDGA